MLRFGALLLPPCLPACFCGTGSTETSKLHSYLLSTSAAAMPHLRAFLRRRRMRHLRRPFRGWAYARPTHDNLFPRSFSHLAASFTTSAMCRIMCPRLFWLTSHWHQTPHYRWLEDVVVMAPELYKGSQKLACHQKVSFKPRGSDRRLAVWRFVGFVSGLWLKSLVGLLAVASAGLTGCSSMGSCQNPLRATVSCSTACQTCKCKSATGPKCD